MEANEGRKTWFFHGGILVTQSDDPYAEAKAAWRDDALQMLDEDGKWSDWHRSVITSEPCWSDPPHHYRRRPSPAVDQWSLFVLWHKVDELLVSHEQNAAMIKRDMRPLTERERQHVGTWSDCATVNPQYIKPNDGLLTVTPMDYRPGMGWGA